MKHLIMLCVLLLAGAGTAIAQTRLSLGVMGGVNTARLDVKGGNEGINNRTGMAVGGVADLMFNGYLGVAVQPMFLQKGAKFKDSDGSVNLRINYIEVPVMFKASYPYRMTSPYLTAGPSVGFRVGSEAKVKASGASADVDFDNVLEGVDFSLAIGGGVSAPAGPARWFIDSRYAFGLTDINKGGMVDVQGTPVEVEDDNTKTRGFAVLAGLTMPINR